ncbi:MAG: chemotaxis protein CheB [Gemmatimonadaceae bacterium]
MAKKDIVVIGASAGGVEALMQLVAGLPADLDASIFVVVHIPIGAPSALPRILSRRGHMPAVHASDGERIHAGTIYVAPPGAHLIIEAKKISLIRGPREHGLRPAVDPLFLSAALEFGPRVVGVLLSGNLDDGTAGLEAIKKRGGTTIVQDPAEALYPGMSLSAIDSGCADKVLPVAQIAAALTDDIKRSRTATLARAEAVDMDDENEEKEKELAIDKLDIGQLQSDDQPGTVSAFTCPECNGTLWELTSSDTLRYRCRVGHAFAVDSLLAKQQESVESAFWIALRALEERASLLRRLSERAQKNNNKSAVRRYTHEEEIVVKRAKTLRDVILSGIVGDETEATAS